jgi:GT2 family glycosyltransferase
MIPTYGAGPYLEATIRSVLLQDLGPERMQVAVVDDATPGPDPRALVERVGDGRVEFHRHATNVGHVRNFDRCLLLARGDLVHILHGDDRVLPGFYATMEAAFDRHPEIGGAFCRNDFVDEAGARYATARTLAPAAGVLADALGTLASWQRIQAPAIVVRREVYERLGGFDPAVAAVGEDWEMWVRIAASYPIWYTPEVLAEYRTHVGSLTSTSLRTGQNGRDLRHVIRVNAGRLPREISARVNAEAERQCAMWLLVLASRLITRREWRAARAQVREALRFRRSPRVLLRVARLTVRAVGLAVSDRLHGGAPAARRGER